MFKLKVIIPLLTLFSVQQIFAQDLIETHQLALHNNPELKSAFFNQYSTAEFRSQSIAKMLPNISLYGSASRERINNKKTTFQANGTQNFWDHAFSINFRQPVFHIEHWIGLGQSDNQIAQSEAQYQATFLELMVKITEAYFNILSAQDNLEFTIAEKTAIGQQLEQANQRFNVGLIAITDVYEAQAGYDKSRADEIEAINLLDDNKEDLREIIGENEANLNVLLDDIPLNLPDPLDIKLWAEAAKSNNFNIIAQLNQTEVIRKEINLQKSAHLPTLDLVASYGVQDNTSTFGARGDTQSIGLELNLPLFEGGAVVSRTRQAQYNFHREQEKLTQVKRAVSRQVRNAYRDVVSSISRVKALQATIISSESALEATEAGFKVGTRTMVDILTEQRNLYRSKRDFSRSRYDYLINGIKLKEAAGSLSKVDLEQINQYLTQ